MATKTSERSIDATIVDVIEGPRHYNVAVGWSYEQKTPTHGMIPLGGEMLLRFSNGNTFKFDVDSGELLEAKQNRTLRRLITVEEAMEKNLRIKKVKTGYACTVPAEGFPEKETSDLAVRYGATKVAKGYRFVATDRASLQTRVFSFIYDSPVPTR